MASHTVVIFGAGATKACGGPLTAEILPRAFTLKNEIKDFDREAFVDTLERFLCESFHLPTKHTRRKNEDYPQLPLLISMLDIAAENGHTLPKSVDAPEPAWSADDVRYLRSALAYTIFAVLEHELRHMRRNYYLSLLKKLYPRSNQHKEPQIISLNYDLIVDNALMQLSEQRSVKPYPQAKRVGTFPNYSCDVATEEYRKRRRRFGLLLKLHGSLNWLFCPGCNRLDIGVSPSGRGVVKMLGELWAQKDLDLSQKYSCRSSPCPECSSEVQPVIVTPTHRKDYRNPHIAHVWYKASRILRNADRAIFVGYSLPEDDVDVVYLLKRGLGHLRAERISVVEKDTHKRPRKAKAHPVGRRYRAVFGDGIEWHAEGFGKFVQAL